MFRIVLSPVPRPPSTAAWPARPASSPASSCAGTEAARRAGDWQKSFIRVVRVMMIPIFRKDESKFYGEFMTPHLVEAILDQPPLVHPHRAPEVGHQGHPSPFPYRAAFKSEIFLLFLKHRYPQTLATAARSLGESREKIFSQSSGGRVAPISAPSQTQPLSLPLF